MAIRVQLVGAADDEVFESGVDWDIDRDRDLTIYDAAFVDATYALAVYAGGSWVRVMRDAPPRAQA